MAIYAYKLGFSVTDTPGNGVIAAAKVTGANYDTFENPVGTDYTVAGSKTFYITRIEGFCTAGPGIFEIGYGNDGVDDTTAPTTPVILTSQLVIDASNAQQSYDVFIPIPTGKLPFLHAITATNFDVTIFGIEV